MPKSFYTRKYNARWSLSHNLGTPGSFILSVPREADVSAIVLFLSKSAPGKTVVIPEETFEGFDIYFRWTAPFNDVFATLKTSLDIPDTAEPRPGGRYQKAVVLFINGVAAEEYPSIVACARALHISMSQVTTNCDRDKRKPGRYDLRYKDKKEPVEPLKNLK